MKAENLIPALCVLLFITMAGNSVHAQQIWGLDRIDQRALPLDGWYFHDSDGGAGVRVYVMDTGIRATHGQFAGRVETGYEAYGQTNNGDDCYPGGGHGTHVAGIIGGRTYGVAKAVRLVPVRVIACNQAEVTRLRQETGDPRSDIVAIERGVQWIINNHLKPAVVNISIEERADAPYDAESNRRFENAVKRLIGAGITTVISAGNLNKSACLAAPSRVMDAITVAASSSTDERGRNPQTGAFFSNFGRCVDIFAPGVDIRSALNTGNTATGLMTGTSQAAPYVAGIAALYLQHHPNASIHHVAEAIRVSATTNKIVNPGSQSPNRLAHSNLVTDDPNNLPPVARNDNVGDIDAGDNLFLYPLLNDTDPNGNSLRIISVTQPSSGRVSIESNGTELFLIPNSGAGRKSFSYVISDSKGGIAQARVSYNVIAR